MFKGLGGLGDMAKMMKSAQEMQGKMAEMQEDLENITVTGESGAGLVKATATAKGELKALDTEVVEGRAANRSEAVRRGIARLQREQRYRGEEAILLDLARRGESVYPDLDGRSTSRTVSWTDAPYRIGTTGQASARTGLDSAIEAAPFDLGDGGTHHQHRAGNH
mgnify:CR=1 FL=1